MHCFSACGGHRSSYHTLSRRTDRSQTSGTGSSFHKRRAEHTKQTFDPVGLRSQSRTFPRSHSLTLGVTITYVHMTAHTTRSINRHTARVTARTAHVWGGGKSSCCTASRDASSSRRHRHHLTSVAGPGGRPRTRDRRRRAQAGIEPGRPSQHRAGGRPPPRPR